MTTFHCSRYGFTRTDDSHGTVWMKFFIAKVAVFSESQGGSQTPRVGLNIRRHIALPTRDHIMVAVRPSPKQSSERPHTHRFPILNGFVSWLRQPGTSLLARKTHSKISTTTVSAYEIPDSVIYMHAKRELENMWAAQLHSKGRWTRDERPRYTNVPVRRDVISQSHEGDVLYE